MDRQKLSDSYQFVVGLGQSSVLSYSRLNPPPVMMAQFSHWGLLCINYLHATAVADEFISGMLCTKSKLLPTLFYRYAHPMARMVKMEDDVIMLFQRTLMH